MAHRKIRKLYERIPTFTCQEGCTACCGPVPFAKSEWEGVEPKLQMTQGIKCPYAQEGKCSIYEQRPFMCRLFGAVDDPRLVCSRGCGPDKKLTIKEGRELLKRYKQVEHL